MRAETCRLPDLKLVTLTDESDRVGNLGVCQKPVGENDAALWIELEHLAGAKQRCREMIALLRVGRERLKQAVDLAEKGIAARVERRGVEGRMHVKTIEPISHQHRPE